MIKTYAYNDAIQLSEHFNSSEFKCKDGRNHEYKINTDLVQNLEKFFSAIPELFDIQVSKIILTSGYRCPSHDKTVGGYGSGPHVEGNAADICCYDENLKPIDSRKVCCAAQEIGFLGIANITSEYIYTHVDMKDRKTASGESYRWFGNEVYSNGQVTNDFWSYYGLARKTNNTKSESVISNGIDVSEWQGTIDYKQVANSIDFAVIRAGYGRLASQIDKRYEENYQGFKKAGVPVGAYWYCYADSVESAKEEAYACLEVLKGKQFELPIFYDILEDDHIPVLKAKGNVSRLINEIVPTFCNILEQAGYFVGVYCNTSGYRNYLNDSNKQRYVQWVADWSGTCGYTGQKVLWQYSAKGTVPGIAGDVDKDYAYTDFAVIKDNGFNGWNSADYQIEPDNPEDKPKESGVIHKGEEPTPEEALNIFEKILKEVQEIKNKL